MSDIVEHVGFLRSWAKDIRNSSGVSVDADRLDAIALSLTTARADGHAEGMEEAARIAEQPITYTFPDGSPAVTRPRTDGTTIASAIRKAKESKT